MINRFNKSIFFVAVVMMCVLSSAPLSEAVNSAFMKGETIDYKITKFGIKVGEAKLVYNGPTQLNNKSVLWVTFTSKGFKFFDEEQIYLDPATFHPVLIKRDLNIFGNQEKINEFYDSQKGKVRIVKTANGETTEQIIVQGDRFDNIYGFIYRQRLYGQFQENELLKLHLPTADVELKLVKLKKIKAGGKKHEAYYMRSIPKKYQIFFDSGAQKIPLRIDGALGAANMAMVMREYHSK